MNNIPKNTIAQIGERPAIHVQNIKKAVPADKPKTAVEYDIASFEESEEVTLLRLKAFLSASHKCRLITHKLKKNKAKKAPTA